VVESSRKWVVRKVKGRSGRGKSKREMGGKRKFNFVFSVLFLEHFVTIYCFKMFQSVIIFGTFSLIL